MSSAISDQLNICDTSALYTITMQHDQVDAEGHNEKFLWSGKPDPVSSMKSRTDALCFGIPSMLISGKGLIAVWEAGAAMSIAIHILFCAISLYILSMPLIAYRSALGMTFAITERRLIAASRHGRDIKSIQRSKIGQVERSEQGGKITLRVPTALVSDNGEGQKVDYLVMHGIPDGDVVYRLLTHTAT